jgi:hypothetical protein
MLRIAHKWDKIAKELQKLTTSRIAHIGKMCKNKWNGLNSDFKKISDYHTWTCHHTSLWELTMEECNKHHLPRQFNKEFYDAIESFQGERVVNKPLHV